MIKRFSSSLLIAALVTFGLFFLMQFLVKMGSGDQKKVKAGHMVDFVRLKKDEEIRTDKRRLPPKPQIAKPPPPPQFNPAKTTKPTRNAGISGPGFNANINMGNVGLGAPGEDQDVLPLFRIPPQYPRRAEERGLEGWVELEFTISKTGAVLNPIIVDSFPPNIFNRSATRALLKWKYKPKIEGGKPVQRPGVRVLITFELEDDKRRRR